jgi:hypothetical protein
MNVFLNCAFLVGLFGGAPPRETVRLSGPFENSKLQQGRSRRLTWRLHGQHDAEQPVDALFTKAMAALPSSGKIAQPILQRDRGNSMVD